MKKLFLDEILCEAIRQEPFSKAPVLLLDSALLFLVLLTFPVLDYHLINHDKVTNAAQDNKDMKNFMASKVFIVPSRPFQCI